MKRAFLLVGVTVVSLFCLASGVFAVDVPAFPGAEGWGAYALGGRGGDVYHVTNLNDDGPGSLRYGISTAGGTAGSPRTIVFDVSGTIALASTLSVNKSYITIAGQTAPGDGICLRDHHLAISASHIIVRYIRSRLGDESLTEDDAISIKSGFNIIMDHISASWSVDEVFSCSTSQPTLGNVTVQWSIISEALWHSIHGKGTHSYGALIRGCYDAKYTYHHNLFAHNYSRNPRPGNYDSTVDDGNPYWEDPCGLLFDFRNNVIYNWGGSRPGYDADLDSVCRYNYVGNYAKPGYNGTAGYLYSAACTYFKGYYAGNYFNGTYSSDDWQWVTWSTSKGGWTQAQKDAYKQSVPFPTGPITTDTALEAYQNVLDDAGASFPFRDSVDTRVVNDVINGTGEIIDTQSQVGGWPTLNSQPAPTDSDHDGMPDAWETSNGLNPSDAADRNGYDLNADYTNLEVYLNGLIGSDTTPPSAPTGLSATPGDGTVSLDWDDNSESDLDGYNVYRSTTSGSGYGQLNGSLLVSSDYVDNSVTNGTTYYYVVTAVDINDYESSYSNEASATPGDSTPPAAPTGLSATAGDGIVWLDWNNNSESDLAGYNVYRSITPGGPYGSPLNGSLLGTSDYVDNSVTNGTTYYYVVTAVDTSSNESGYSSEVSASPSSAPGAMGTILREWWTGIPGSSVSDLNSHPDFPDNPTGSNQLTSLEAPTDWADSYGTLISGYLHPPTGGSYTFWIASDDNSELWLSTDGNPENASMIANVPGDTNPRQWDKYTEQQSSPISLAAGQKYYIEALHKEGAGSDNLAVAWSGPGISQQVIYGVYLSPWFIGLYGDSTGNGIVDMNDLSDFMAMWLEDDCAESSAWDLDGDCVVNLYEFSELSWNWLVTEQDTTPPAAPTGLSATPGDGTVSLDWDDNSESDLAGYYIYRSTTQGSGYGQLNGLLLDSDYTDNSVTNGTTYYYVVTAVDTSLNESGYSNEASATPSEPVTSITIQENETGFCGVDGDIESEHTGHTGDGYANTDNASGNGIDYKVNILTAGTYTFIWRYAHGKTEDRTARLLVNGSEKASSIAFPPTGAWTSWSTTSSVDVTLSTGIKDIRLEATAAATEGLANIDYMEVTGSNLNVASCP